MSVTLDGLDELKGWLEVSAPNLASKLAGDMVLDVAEGIAGEARRIMPVNTGKMRAQTSSKRGRSTKTLKVAEVHCGAFYWIFLEHGDGPDGVEHAMFRRAQETVQAGLDRAEFPRFRKRLQDAFK